MGDHPLVQFWLLFGQEKERAIIGIEQPSQAATMPDAVYSLLPV